MRKLLLIGGLMVVAGLACGGFGAGEPAPTPTAEKSGKAGKGAKSKQMRERLEQRDDGAGSPAKGSAGSGSSGGGGTAPAGIVQLNATTWSVERKQVRQWENKPSRFSDASQESGGVRLKKVSKRDARFVGFQNKDLIKSINGHALGSTAQSAAAYAAISGAKTFTVKFKRDGRTLQHTLKIKD